MCHWLIDSPPEQSADTEPPAILAPGAFPLGAAPASEIRWRITPACMRSAGKSRFSGGKTCDSPAGHGLGPARPPAGPPAGGFLILNGAPLGRDSPADPTPTNWTSVRPLSAAGCPASHYHRGARTADSSRTDRRS